MSDPSLRAFLAEQVLPDGGAAVDVLLGVVHIEHLDAGSAWWTPTGNDAQLILVIDGLVVVEPEDEEAPCALKRGGARALPARRDPARSVALLAVRASRLARIVETDYAPARDAGSPPFELLLRSVPVMPGLRVPGEHQSRAPTSEAGPLNQRLRTFMTRTPIVVGPREAIDVAARRMRDHRVSCLPVTEGRTLVGLITEADMTARVVAARRSPDDPVGSIMSAPPLSAGSDATLYDALMLLTEHDIAHLPVTDRERLVGLITQTDIVRRQTASPLFVARDIARCTDADAIAVLTAGIGQTVRSLVDAGTRPTDICRAITSITDAATRRLAALAERHLGPAPVPWVWVACGSQGRNEQTGVSDQDNALILSDDYDEAAHGAWFTAFAAHVCDGLATAGYVHCPGDMMATNPRWRQPVSRWRERFLDWIARPLPESRLLASVMFDLRPIVGDVTLFEPLQRSALDAAAKNSLFIAHMTGHSLGLRPPLGLFGRLATERRGPFRDHIDLKHRGTAPVVDMARLYALSAAVPALNTVERLDCPSRSPASSPALSDSARLSLRTAWESISRVRLRLQADQVRAGEPPGNHLDPDTLSELAREQLRDAFVAVRDIQNALRDRSIG